MKCLPTSTNRIVNRQQPIAKHKDVPGQNLHQEKKKRIQKYKCVHNKLQQINSIHFHTPSGKKKLNNELNEMPQKCTCMPNFFPSSRGLTKI